MSAAAKVGLFAIVILVILGMFILRIEDLEFGGGDTKQLDIIFDTVAGLDEKAPVRVAGVRVGEVESIQLQSDGRARVRLEIDEDVDLRQGASAQISALGLLGEKYVELFPGDQRAASIETPGTTPVIRGASVPTIDQVTSQVSEIAKDVKAITTSLRASLGGPEGEQRMEEIVENVRLVTAKVRMLLEVNEGNVNATAENLRVLTADLRTEIPRIAQSIDRVLVSIGGTVGENREDVRVLVGNLRTLSSDLRTTADNLNDITGGVRRGEGTIGKLFQSDEAHDRLTGALTSVESGVTELKNTLGRVGRIQMDLGLQSQYYVGLTQDPLREFEGNSRSGIHLKLNPNPERNRFYNIELNDDPQGKRNDKITTVTVIDQAGNETTTTTRQTKYERDFLVSAQAGWQLDELALRVGLFDSTGGVGADYDYNDRIRVTGEAFDFGKRRDDQPHVRVLGRYEFRREKPTTPALFLTTGIDNPLNDTAFTFGGGIRWRDDDLKYLLGSVPLGN
jgi:phospholipid/cholesterol/gamma-HCH transport system substrate-binding protein